MKICTKCKVKKPFEAFWRNKKSKDGHAYECKECMKARAKKIKQDPLMQLEKQIRSSIMLENKILSREGKKLCCSCKGVFLIEDLMSGVICKECNRKSAKGFYEKNKEKIKENRKEYSKEYYEKNKERIREYKKEQNKENYEKNKEKIKEQKREYRLKNKEKIKEYKEKNKEKIKEYKRLYNKEYYKKKKLERLENESM